MNDIVERLRDDQPGERQCVREARMDLGGLLMEAAAEIEKLRAALRGLLDWAGPIAGDTQIVSERAYEEETVAIARAALGEKE